MFLVEMISRRFTSPRMINRRCFPPDGLSLDNIAIHVALVERIAEQSIHGTPLIFVCILTYDIYYWLSGFCFAMKVIAEILNATLKLCYIGISL